MMIFAQSIFAKNVCLLIQFILSQGFLVSFGEAFRTPEQARIDAAKHIGITHSLHCNRLAIDLNIHDKNGKYLTQTKDYEFAGKYWESLYLHNKWGGHFTSGSCKGADGNHFEQRDL